MYWKSACIGFVLNGIALGLPIPVQGQIPDENNVPPGDYQPEYEQEPPPARIKPLPPQRIRQDVKPPVKDFRVTALQSHYTGDLWVGSWLGLARIDPNTGAIISRISLPNYKIGALAQDKVGRIWVGTHQGLLRVDSNLNSVTVDSVALPSQKILSLLIDKRGFLWVGGDRGLTLVSPDKGLQMTTLQELPGVSANALTLDK
ncbi:MAG: two-component regulator propeller domain-containing protein, partial [Spirulinaceae cyanobacterium]